MATSASRSLYIHTQLLKPEPTPVRAEVRQWPGKLSNAHGPCCHNRMGRRRSPSCPDFPSLTRMLEQASAAGAY
ncbi:hypothetical protein FOXYSP1_07213 [Fusarium oxysporum f. sp. phaseoli]